MNLGALLAHASPSTRACYGLIRERWRSRPTGAETVTITFDEFGDAGARRDSIPAAIDALERAGLVARAGLAKRPRGHPAGCYRLLVDITANQAAA